MRDPECDPQAKPEGTQTPAEEVEFTILVLTNVKERIADCDPDRLTLAVMSLTASLAGLAETVADGLSRKVERPALRLVK